MTEPVSVHVVPHTHWDREWYLPFLAFGVYPHAGSWSDADVLDALERYLHPFTTAAGTGPAAPPPEPRPGLELTGRGVVLSSLRRRGEELEVRLVCEQEEPRRAVLRGDFARAREADLLGRPGAALPAGEDGLQVELAPWEIRTLLLRR